MKPAGPAGRQDPREGLTLQLYSKGIWRQTSLFFGRPQIFLLRPSVVRMRPTHTVMDNLLYLKFTDLNVNLI